MKQFQAFSRPFEQKSDIDMFAPNKKQKTQFIQRTASPLQFSLTGLSIHALLTLAQNFSSCFFSNYRSQCAAAASRMAEPRVEASEVDRCPPLNTSL